MSERVDERVAPLLAGQGFELVLTEYIARSRVLRLFIDRADPEGAVTLDDCTQVTHLVSDFLDNEGVSDTIEGHYTLEVSSPGLDRPLVKPAHYRRFVGNEVQVVLRKPDQNDKGRRKYKGRLASADPDGSGGICVEIDGSERTFAYEAIGRARLVPEF